MPAGAASGPITVTSRGGTATSASPFTVIMGPSVLTFAPAHDAHVYSASPTTSYGGVNTLRVRGNPSGFYNSYLKFDVSGVVGGVQSAVLRLYVTDESPDAVRRTASRTTISARATPWVEDGIT